MRGIRLEQLRNRKRLRSKQYQQDEKHKKRRETGRMVPVALLFLLLIPYLGSLMAGGDRAQQAATVTRGDAFVEVDRRWGKERIPLEEYLLGMMAATILPEYEREVLKAQSLLLRSWCLSLARKEGGYDLIPGEEVESAYLSERDCIRIWKEDYQKYSDLFQEILEETKGMILVSGGQIVSPPFFRVSSGSTRRVEEYQAYPGQWSYLRSVSCPQDVEAEEYLERVEMKEGQFRRKIGRLLNNRQWVMDKITLYRDSADYVKLVQIGEERIQGEDFRRELGLASSCFTLQKQDKLIVIKTRGMGHGFGFSQYQANQLARQGQDYRQLLENFFQGLSVERL